VAASPAVSGAWMAELPGRSSATGRPGCPTNDGALTNDRRLADRRCEIVARQTGRVVFHAGLGAGGGTTAFRRYLRCLAQRRSLVGGTLAPGEIVTFFARCRPRRCWLSTANPRRCCMPAVTRSMRSCRSIGCEPRRRGAENNNQVVASGSLRSRRRPAIFHAEWFGRRRGLDSEPEFYRQLDREPARPDLTS